MESIACMTTMLLIFGILSSHQSSAHSPGQPSTGFAAAIAKSLDSLLRDYSFHGVSHPRTGVTYQGKVPSNISGVRTFRGLKRFHEFDIPDGVIARPYVQRLALVYQNLENWSSIYYRLPGHRFIAPVLGLLAYEAEDLPLTNSTELHILATEKPISIKFRNLAQKQAPSADLRPGNVCITRRQGHFSVVVNSGGLVVPNLRPGGAADGWSNIWRIAGAVAGGFLFLVLSVLLLMWVKVYRREKRMKEMVHHAESEEACRSSGLAALSYRWLPWSGPGLPSRTKNRWPHILRPVNEEKSTSSPHPEFHADKKVHGFFIFCGFLLQMWICFHISRSSLTLHLLPIINARISCLDPPPLPSSPKFCTHNQDVSVSFGQRMAVHLTHVSTFGPSSHPREDEMTEISILTPHAF
ncbi:unnamed protein product [Spirodela intermedia]|uniref:Uncharacterized protein n=1 Tax=Spirodela intermedia TaxID=51605 RepID=A0A7I8JH08_SPIIN|nr:unnamed protein product [Spirodela intermedia]CAA6669221.1 unnamed protein product [Spirodela intermedia]